MSRTAVLVTIATLSALASPNWSVAANSTVLATVDGAPVTEAEVRKVIQGKLIELESQMYEARKDGVDSIVQNRLLEKEAKARKLSIDALLQQEVASKVTEPTAAEIESLYEQNKERIGKPIDEVREAIVQHLQSQRLQAARDAYLEQLKSKAKIRLNIKPPVVEVPGTGQSQGPADAPVTIIEFSDFQCPYCGKAEESVSQVLSTYKGKIRLVYRDFPLGFHQFAQKAAEASHCAGDQNKYWEYHGKLFANQTALDRPNLEQYATDLKLDLDKFKKCLDDDKYTAAVQKDVEIGGSVGVNGTPAFFVNGRFLSGAQPFESFKEIIDEILKEKGKAS